MTDTIEGEGREGEGREREREREREMEMERERKRESKRVGGQLVCGNCDRLEICNTHSQLRGSPQ